MRLIGALHGFWYPRHPGEGLQYARAVLAQPEATGHSVIRARALYCAGDVEFLRGDRVAAQRLLDEALAIARAVDDKRTVRRSLIRMGQIQLVRKNYPPARMLFEEALANSREANDSYDVSRALWLLGDAALSQDDVPGAQVLYEESATVCKMAGEKLVLGGPLRRLGQIALRQGDYAHAGALLHDSLNLYIEIDDRRAIAACLMAAAALAAAQQRAPEAVRLCGSVDALLESIQTEVWAFDADEHQRNVAKLQTQVGPAAYNSAWTEGRKLNTEQALVEAERVIASSMAARPAAQPEAANPADLTARELEVLRLLAQGLTDAQIAETLVVSTRTVNAHLRSIYSKLDVTTRTAAVRAAQELHLV
jgi:ATP/maltotriose-dependent transcriptional regulator MalT